MSYMMHQDWKNSFKNKKSQLIIQTSKSSPSGAKKQQQPSWTVGCKGTRGKPGKLKSIFDGECDVVHCCTIFLWDLDWKYSARWESSIWRCRLLSPLPRAGMTDLDQTFCMWYFLCRWRAASKKISYQHCQVLYTLPHPEIHPIVTFILPSIYIDGMLSSQGGEGAIRRGSREFIREG